ncbi:MAG: nucleotide pyrophosphatase, partial [Phenylobacterium sp.]|nr:nucleotide pyrophosphatase [Phenylobacterium sp.]
MSPTPLKNRSLILSPSRCLVRAALAPLALLCAAAAAAAQPHNVIIFVADGLRSKIVSAETAPALAEVRDRGVDFRNSHSLYPTVTTPNASAIATGHALGDTGDFGNTLYVGQPFPAPYGTPIAPVEDDAILGLLNQRYGGDYLGHVSLLRAAQAKGYETAVVGKLGPAAIQDVTARGAGTIVIDDATGLAAGEGVPVAPEIVAAIKAAGLLAVAPDRGLNTWPGAYNMPGVQVANIDQQAWFTRIVTEVLLPRFKAE